MPLPPNPGPYDVAVAGAGVAGLNALAVASKYLTEDDRVLSSIGGIGPEDVGRHLPYVRLHQPHRFFAATDIKWTLDADRAYLATKNEVLDHFSHSVDVVKGRVGLDEWPGTELLSHEAGKETIRLTCQSADRRRIAPSRVSVLRWKQFDGVPLGTLNAGYYVRREALMKSWDLMTVKAEPHEPRILSTADATLLLLLSPWPGNGHPGSMTLEQKAEVRERAAGARRMASHNASGDTFSPAGRAS